MTGVFTDAPATMTCPLVRAGSSARRSRPTDSTLSATRAWSTGFTMRMIHCVMHWDNTSLSSRPGRWLMRPTATPNLRPSERTCFRTWLVMISALAGA